MFIFVLALVGVFYPYNRGALFTALVVIYALTSGIAGYTASSFYCQLEGSNWVCVGSVIFNPQLFVNSCLSAMHAIKYLPKTPNYYIVGDTSDMLLELVVCLIIKARKLHVKWMKIIMPTVK